MVTGSSLNLKEIIDILKRETTPRENHRYTHWEEVILDNGERVRRKDDFSCYRLWRKVPLYEVQADEFLIFAKQDLLEDSERGRVNALTNAKRVIECRIDECLALLNFKFFASQERWNLPYKMQVLQTFGIPTPNILKNLVTSKRNLLEHEYIKPKDQQEAQNIVDVAELFLKATDEYVKRGYLSSALVTCTAWFEDAKNKRFASYCGMSNEYKLDFDLKSETLTLTLSEKELVRKQHLKTGALAERQLGSTHKKETVTLPIRDCPMEDIRELMVLLRQKGELYESL